MSSYAPPSSTSLWSTRSFGGNGGSPDDGNDVPTRLSSIRAFDTTSPEYAPTNVSKSYFKPRNLHMYTQALSTVRQEGWLEMRMGDDANSESTRMGSSSEHGSKWNRYWFDLEKDVLLWFRSDDDARAFKTFDDDVALGFIPLDRIVKVSVTSERQDSLSIAVRHKKHEPATTYHLRAATKSERNLWLHSFHSCVAWLISTITRRQLRAKSSSHGDSHQPSTTAGGGEVKRQMSAGAFTRNENAFDEFNYGGSRGISINRPNSGAIDHSSSLDDEMLSMPAQVPRERNVHGQGKSQAPSSEDVSRTMFQRQLTIAPHVGRGTKHTTQDTADGDVFSRSEFADGEFADLDDGNHNHHGDDDDDDGLFVGDMEFDVGAGQGDGGHGEDDDDEGLFSMTGEEFAQTPAPAPPPQPAKSRFGSSSGSRYVPPFLRRRMQQSEGTGDAGHTVESGKTTGDTGGDSGTGSPSTQSAGTKSDAPAKPCNDEPASEVGAGSIDNSELYAMSGVCAIQGARKKMEDRDVVIDDFNRFWNQGAESSDSSAATVPSATGSASEASLQAQRRPGARHSFYAVFDGHDGVQAAEFAATRICSYATERQELFANDPMKALVAAIRRIDEEFLELAAASNGAIYCGTTALTTYIRGNKVFTCTVGDSRCVLSRGGVSLELSRVLTPGTPSERERIEAAGGWITEENELVLARLHHMKLEDPLAQQKLKSQNYLSIVTHRVNGCLSVSRALGDPEYKGKPDSPLWMFPKEHPKVFTADLVSSEPCVHEETLQADDEFLILACDGLWDVLNGQDAVDIIKSRFDLNATPKAAAEFLVQKALQLGTSDNVSVVVVPLK